MLPSKSKKRPTNTERRLKKWVDSFFETFPSLYTKKDAAPRHSSRAPLCEGTVYIILGALYAERKQVENPVIYARKFMKLKYGAGLPTDFLDVLQLADPIQSDEIMRETKSRFDFVKLNYFKRRGKKNTKNLITPEVKTATPSSPQHANSGPHRNSALFFNQINPMPMDIEEKVISTVPCVDPLTSLNPLRQVSTSFPSSPRSNTELFATLPVSRPQNDRELPDSLYASSFDVSAPQSENAAPGYRFFDASTADQFYDQSIASTPSTATHSSGENGTDPMEIDDNWLNNVLL